MNNLPQYLREVEERLGAISSIKWKDAGDWFHDYNVACGLHQDEDIEQAVCDLIAHAPTDLRTLIAMLRLAIEQRDEWAPYGGGLEHEQALERANAELSALIDKGVKE